MTPAETRCARCERYGYSESCSRCLDAGVVADHDDPAPRWHMPLGVGEELEGAAQRVLAAGRAPAATYAAGAVARGIQSIARGHDPVGAVADAAGCDRELARRALDAALYVIEGAELRARRAPRSRREDRERASRRYWALAEDLRAGLARSEMCR